MFGKKVLAALAIPVSAAAISMATAPNAQAINRVSCNNYGFLWIYSNQTTCWANAGTAYVGLYGVQGLSSGNNAGNLRSSSGALTYFSKYQQKNFYYTQTINRVRIY
jgi:hypothetical protein